MKNKYQEALDNVRKVYVESEHYDEEDIRLLQELINEKIPMKVIEATAYGTTRAVKCPVCNKRYSKANKNKYIYCPHCSQKLDWSDDDE